jgi:3-deoxy-manno-octulosonate cytidylyltransferase (CMP-KDO synthetase)
MSNSLNDVYIATCDREIMEYAQSVGANCVMTADTHERCTDRVAEAVMKIENNYDMKVDIVVMIQGDEPLVTPGMIDNAVKPMLEDSTINIVNLMSSIKTRKEHNDPNEVKVVIDKEHFALYFSREPIPSWKKTAEDVPMMKQVCIIPFRRPFLTQFSKLEPTPLEIIESVDMLRALEHGYKVKMALSNDDTYSVDTKEDLDKVSGIMIDDDLFRQYSGKKP